MPTSNVTASTVIAAARSTSINVYTLLRLFLQFANVARLLRDGTRIFRLFLFVRWFTFSLIDLQSQVAYFCFHNRVF